MIFKVEQEEFNFSSKMKVCLFVGFCGLACLACLLGDPHHLFNCLNKTRQLRCVRVAVYVNECSLGWNVIFGYKHVSCFLIACSNGKLAKQKGVSDICTVICKEGLMAFILALEYH